MTRLERIKAMEREEFEEFFLKASTAMPPPFCRELEECDDILASGEDVNCMACLRAWLEEEI